MMRKEPWSGNYAVMGRGEGGKTRRGQCGWLKLLEAWRLEEGK
jgi:hypothetical protein